MESVALLESLPGNKLGQGSSSLRQSRSMDVDLVIVVLTPLTIVNCLRIAGIREGLSHVDTYPELVTGQLGEEPVGVTSAGHEGQQSKK